MATKVEVEVETRFGDLEMLVAVAPFDQAKTAIESAGGKLATAQQVAQARIVAGTDSNVSQYGSWVAEGFVYAPKSLEVYLVSGEQNPILKHPVEATKAHRNEKEFCVSKDEFAAVENAVKSGKAISLPKNKSYEIPISKLRSSIEGKFLFKEDTQKYAEFLQKAGVNEVPVWLAGLKYQKVQKAPFARALWLNCFSYESGLFGINRNLDVGSGRARGVRKASGSTNETYESIAQKYGLKSPDKLQDVLEKYSQIKGLVKE